MKNVHHNTTSNSIKTFPQIILIFHFIAIRIKDPDDTFQYAKESWWLASDEYSYFKYVLQGAFIEKIFSKFSGLFGAMRE